MYIILTRGKGIKIEMEIPSWAIHNPLPTLIEVTRDLIMTLPTGYCKKTKAGEIWNGFHAQTIHNKIIQMKGFETRSIRRTREALQYHCEKGLLGLVPVTRVFNGYRVKMYYRK